MFAKFMNKKDFHPGSKANIKRVWMAEQKILAESQKEKDLELQYNKEQAKFKNRQAISNDDRIKSGLDFLYDAPPGFNKESKKPEEEEGEVRFEWQRGAPREAYTKSLGIEARDQPFGIPVRNVKCIRCGKWGHINTDRECPLFNKSRNADVDPSLITDIADPMRLLKDMRTEGLTLKQNVLGRVFNPDDPNQQIVASDEEEEDDVEAAFLASLTDKQKKKLLRKLNRLEQEEMDAQESSTKHKKKKRKKSHQSDSDEEPKKHAKKKHHKQSDSSDSEEQRNKKRSKKKEKSSNLKDSPERETKEKHRHSEDSERYEHHGATYRHSKDFETVRHRSNTGTSRYYRSDDRYEDETHRHKDRGEHHRYNESGSRHKHTGDKRR